LIIFFNMCRQNIGTNIPSYHCISLYCFNRDLDPPRVYTITLAMTGADYDSWQAKIPPGRDRPKDRILMEGPSLSRNHKSKVFVEGLKDPATKKQHAKTNKAIADDPTRASFFWMLNFPFVLNNMILDNSSFTEVSKEEIQFNDRTNPGMAAVWRIAEEEGGAL
jgi:hypothetical protein